MIRFITLRLSLWLGYKRQAIIRQARSNSALKGWQTRRARHG